MPATGRPIQRSFAFGELSPYLIVRADLDRWRGSLKLCRNCVTMPQGGLTKRSGTMRIYQALASSVLFPFRYSRSDGYAVEAAAGVFRFFRDYGIVMNDAGTAPFELATPFAAAEIAKLWYTQSANVMFLSTGARPLQKLSRTSHTSWTIADAAIEGGPFLTENDDDNVWLYTTSTAELKEGVTFTLRAYGADVFDPKHVGAQWLIKNKDGGKHGTWKNATDYSVGDIVYYGDNWYKCVATIGANSDENPPTHTDGARWDGASDSGGGHGCKWLYLHSGFGIVKITGYTDARHVTAEVMNYVPDELYVSASDVPSSGDWPGLTDTTIYGTNRWAEGAWSEKNGYPKIVLVAQDRLIAFSTDHEPSKWWASCFDDYENFLAGSLDTDGFDRTVMGDDEVSEILWAASGRRLAIGTSGPEFVVQASSSRQRLTPDNAYTDPATGEGSAPIRPVRIDLPIFVSKDLRRLLALGLADNGEDYAAEDLTLFADHISEGDFAGLAWQRDPYRVLWAWKADGGLVGLTYRPDQGVKGWHRHTMTHEGVQSAVCVPSADGNRQDLWTIVERALPAGTKRYVEVMMPFFERGDLEVTNGWFVDCGTRYEGAAATEFTPGSDFNGATLWVLADGKFSQRTVADGKFTLDTAASQVLWGLPYDGEIESLPYDGGDGGASSARKSRVAALALRLRNSCLVGACAISDSDTEPLLPTGGGTLGAAPELFSGVLKATVAGDWEDGGVVRVKSDGPFPMTVLSMTPILQIAR